MSLPRHEPTRVVFQLRSSEDAAQRSVSSRDSVTYSNFTSYSEWKPLASDL